VQHPPPHLALHPKHLAERILADSGDGGQRSTDGERKTSPPSRDVAGFTASPTTSIGRDSRIIDPACNS